MKILNFQHCAYALEYSKEQQRRRPFSIVFSLLQPLAKSFQVNFFVGDLSFSKNLGKRRKTFEKFLKNTTKLLRSKRDNDLRCK